MNACVCECICACACAYVCVTGRVMCTHKCARGIPIGTPWLSEHLNLNFFPIYGKTFSEIT